MFKCISYKSKKEKKKKEKERYLTCNLQLHNQFFRKFHVHCEAKGQSKIK